MSTTAIFEKIQAGIRIDDQDFLTLVEVASLPALGLAAAHIRQRLHPEPIVTYVIDRNINYTDICTSACKFCAFYKAPEDPSGQLLSQEVLLAKIKETQALGGTQVLLQGGLHPDKPLSYYEEMVRGMKQTGIHVHGFSPPEIVHFAQLAR